jgi:hypothetical protein
MSSPFDTGKIGGCWAAVPSQPIPDYAEAAALVLERAAYRIRTGQSVKDTCDPLVDVIRALAGRI